MFRTIFRKIFRKIFNTNRCNRELNSMLFGCIYFYMALQFLSAHNISGMTMHVQRNIYYITIPTGMFLCGYRFKLFMDQEGCEQTKRRHGWLAVRYYVYFFVIALLQEIIQEGNTLRIALVRVLSAVSIPSVSVIFFVMAIMMLLIWSFPEYFEELADSRLTSTVIGLICLPVALLRYSDIPQYALVQVVIQSLIPFIGYFLMGMWMADRIPGMQKNTMLGFLTVSAAALLLMRSPFKDVGRTAVMAFPLYLLFLLMQVISRLTNRYPVCYYGMITAEPVCSAAGVLIAFFCYFKNHAGETSLKKSIPFAICLIAAIYLLLLLFTLFRRFYTWAEYRLIRVKHQTTAYFLIYSASFVVMLLLAFSPFLLEGRDLLWRTDGIPQYYPKAVYYAEYIKNLISSIMRGNFDLPMYDFSIGMGSAVTYSMEPLYVLFALFGRKNIQLAYNVITLLRFYFAGISMSVLCLYFKKEYISTFVASMVYVFCGFSLYGGARHTMFMIPMIMLPLLILSIEEILQRKRWYLCTIFVAVSLFSNYYYLYMNTIAMGVYFLVRYFCQEKKEEPVLSGFIRNGLRISGAYLLGVGMSCIVLTTTFGSYISSGRSGASSINIASLFFYEEQWFVKCFLSFLTTAVSPGYWMKLGLMPIALLAVTFLFAGKGRKELKLLAVITGILMLFPFAGYVFSGFDSVINRWCYIIAFLAAFVTADCLPDMREMSRRELLACIGITGIYGFLAFFGIWMVSRYTQLAFIFLLITLGILLLSQNKVHSISRAAKNCLLLLLTAGMVFYNGFSLFYMAGAVEEYTKIGRAEPKAANTPLAALCELEDDSFYRAAAPKLDYLTVSASLMLGYNSISQFSSTINGAITQYMEQMGNTGYSVTQMLGFNNRVFLNALAAVKYYASYENPKKKIPYGYQEIRQTTANEQAVTLYENQYALPLGYTYDTAITQEELEQYDVVERQEVMMQSVVLHEERTPEWAKAQAPELTSVPLKLTAREENGIELCADSLNTTKKGSIKLHFQSLPDSETYLVLKNAVIADTDEAITLTFKTKGNSTEYRFRGEEDRYGTGQQDYVFNLGYHEEAIDSCRILSNKKGEIRFDEIQIICQPMNKVSDYSEKLRENVLENVEVKTNQITGTIELEEDKYLVLSIPYQKGWTAIIDGEEVPLERANYMYMALPVSAGSHTVELHFQIPGIRYALGIMAFSWLLFLLLCIASWIRSVKKWVIKRKA